MKSTHEQIIDLGYLLAISPSIIQSIMEKFDFSPLLACGYYRASMQEVDENGNSLHLIHDRHSWNLMEANRQIDRWSKRYNLDYLLGQLAPEPKPELPKEVTGQEDWLTRIERAGQKLLGTEYVLEVVEWADPDCRSAGLITIFKKKTGEKRDGRPIVIGKGRRVLFSDNKIPE